MDKDSPPGSITFDRFEWRPAERRLLSDGKPVALGARAIDVLTALVDRRDRVVSKHELMDHVWPSVVVEENNLQVQISGLRKVLGASAISTVPGRGYRFTAPTSRTAEHSPGIGAISPSTSSTHAIPERGSRMVGRQAELAALLTLASSHALVTVVGPGGIGKTRLVRAVFDGLREAHVEGIVAWLDLSPLTDGSLVPAAIAAAAALPLAEGVPQRDALIGGLRRRPALIVLDNCEHLIEAVADTARALLTETELVSMLTTSRRPLGVPGEHVYRLGPLPVPPPGLPVHETERYDAVDLFVSRVRASDHAFQASGSNINNIVDVCRTLDGIPLALELAAARVHSLGLVKLIELLEDRLRLLINEDRAAVPRHRTMRAAFDWSHDLLCEEDKIVYRRLAVFAGGFMIDAARRVVADDLIDEWAVVESLARLVDLSLVAPGAGDPPRYLLLETGRRHAKEKLAGAGEIDELQRRHAVYFRDHVVRAYQSWVDGPEEQWLDATANELDNLRAALHHALGPTGDATTAIALAGSAMPVWLDLHLEDYTEGRRYVDRASELVSLDQDSETCARLWFAQGMLAPALETEFKAAAYGRAASAFHQAGCTSAWCLSLIALGRVKSSLGAFEDAQACFESARPLLSAKPSAKLPGLHAHAIGRLELALGHSQAALAQFKVAHARFLEAGCEALSLLAFVDLGQALRASGALEEARAHMHDAARQVGNASITNKQSLLDRIAEEFALLAA